MEVILTKEANRKQRAEAGWTYASTNMLRQSPWYYSEDDVTEIARKGDVAGTWIADEQFPHAKDHHDHAWDSTNPNLL